MKIVSAAWEVVSTDNVVRAGVPSSGVSLWGAMNLADVQQMLAIFAAFFGGLSAAAVCVYTCLRIKRLLASPKAVD